MDWNFELVAGPYGDTTEGPAWDGQALLFTHIRGNHIMRYDPKTSQTTEYFTGTKRTNGLCFDAKGNLYGCEAGGQRIVRYEKDRKTITPLPHLLDGKRINTPNDLAVDKKGRIWFSAPWSRSLAPEGGPELDHQSVLRLDPKGNDQWELHRVTWDTTYPNGILVSRDQSTLYVAQSPHPVDEPRQLRAYPINEDGTPGKFITLHTFGVDHRGEQRGIDGMTLDAEGNIVAGAGGEESGPGPMIYVFSPRGQVLETHPIRVNNPTNCCFGDPDMRSLYVTSLGGHLFRARTDREGWIMWP